MHCCTSLPAWSGASIDNGNPHSIWEAAQANEKGITKFYYNGYDNFSQKEANSQFSTIPLYMYGASSPEDFFRIITQSYDPYEPLGLTPGIWIYGGGRWHINSEKIDPDNPELNGMATSSAKGSEYVTYATTRFAYNSKDDVSELYGVDMRFYTIGYDIDGDLSGYALKTLDPSGNGGAYSYNDGYWDAGTTGGGEDISRVFDHIYDAIENVPRYNPINESPDLVYTDKLGEFMEINGDIAITWGGVEGRYREEEQ